MARIALFGFGGFLGRHVRSALSGHQVLPIGRSPASDRDVHVDLAESATSAIAQVLADFQPDAVINCTGAMVGSARQLTLANVVAVATLVDAVADAAPGARLVQLGSAAEYGARAVGERATEDSAARPTSMYGATKLAATELVMTATALGSVDGLVLRLFNPVGAGMSEATLPGRAAAVFRDALRTGSRRVEFGDLSGNRDFVDARDVAEAIVSASLIQNLGERVINCGSGEATSARALIAAVAKVAGYDGEIAEDTAGSPRSSRVHWLVADTRRAEHALEWAATRSLDDAIRRLWEGSASASERST
jgi:nucleoside-diphosphate-sugar epimerase